MTFFLKFSPAGTETIAKWSPLGTYLATFHGKGVALWGGEKFEKINRFAHPNAEFIDFSPCERFVKNEMIFDVIHCKMKLFIYLIFLNFITLPFIFRYVVTFSPKAERHYDNPEVLISKYS